ncbi:hypothetical protein LEP3755_14930 [Leptolyngbya sp. NIES-3755]|nr:hypothetical protein LEP3755_14930 [Leptolyngbya sp. NIES-3755]
MFKHVVRKLSAVVVALLLMFTVSIEFPTVAQAEPTQVESPAATATIDSPTEAVESEAAEAAEKEAKVAAKEAEKEAKAAAKAEKKKLKEQEKAQKKAAKEAEKAEKKRLKAEKKAAKEAAVAKAAEEAATPSEPAPQ